MSGSELIKYEEIQNTIYTIRGVQVMLDEDLALLYGVETKVLNQAVKRNNERFPKEFMFQINNDESNVATAHPTAAELRGMTCRRFTTQFLFEIQQLHLLATFLFFFSTLRLNISLYNISCNSISNRPYISTITPKMSTP